MNRTRQARRHRSVVAKPGDQTLPCSARTVHCNTRNLHAILRADDFGRTDRCSFRWHGRQITAHAEAAMQRVLSERERAELGERGRSYYLDNFSEKVAVERMTGLLERAAKETRR